MEPGLCCGQRLCQISENHVAGIGNGIWVGGDLSIEHEDLVVGQALAKVIVCPAVAEAQLQNDAREAANHRHRSVNATPLRL
jgi:hypothetical protein